MAALNSNSFYHRPEAKFSPSLWGDHFINHISDSEVKEKYTKKVEVLKNVVRSMLTAPEAKMIDTMNLIDTLERLGVSYHFENEIEQKLQQFFHLNTNYEDDDEAYDLYTVALHFRLFRQHGHHISTEIFSKWMDVKGKFQESIKNNPKGMLSLYEASYVRTRGETILDDALSFTTATLKSMAPNLGSPLKKQVVHALVQPLHLGISRVEARSFISMYEEEDHKNETLIKFAKLDYNLLQMQHKEELHQLSRNILQFYEAEIFSKWMDVKGKFQESIKSDPKSMLSLYEASYLRTRGETILDDALAFTTATLKSMTPNLGSPLKNQVVHALVQPLHLGLPRVEARSFISMYEEEHHKNETLLKFAKLDFNLLQMLHKEELRQVSR